MDINIFCPPLNRFYEDHSNAWLIWNYKVYDRYYLCFLKKDLQYIYTNRDNCKVR